MQQGHAEPTTTAKDEGSNAGGGGVLPGACDGPAGARTRPGAPMLLGAHVSARGGLDRAIDLGVAIGAQVIQTHPSPPQTWRPLALDAEAVELFKAKWPGSGLRAHYLHAVYLVNLAADTRELVRQSVASLVHHLEIAASLGASGVVFHPGSHKGAGFEARRLQVGSAIGEVLARSDSPAQLLLENSAGQGGCVGSSFSEVAALLEAAPDDARLGFCLDTCHAFASGHDLSNAAGAARVVDALVAELGTTTLALVHANDSRTALGGRSDRHANLGEGEIGWPGFRALLGDPRLRSVPWVLETPGDGSGPTRAALEELRAVARECAPVLPQSAAAASPPANGLLSIMS